MPFTPLTPHLLVDRLARWVADLPGEHPAVGMDGATELGAADLTDAIAERVRELGRPVLRISTPWWWRPASLRLELGRTDIDMLLHGWVDAAALRREVFGAMAPGGSGTVIQRLRDPVTDRSVRDQRFVVDDVAVVLVDGPFLLAADLPIDRVVHLQVSAAALGRALPAERGWWLGAFERYRREYHPETAADVVISYDHPASPAVRWPSDPLNDARDRAC